MNGTEYDVFISYASEDRAIAQSLADALSHRRLRVWIDKSVLKIGDSIRRKVDQGLANSRYGVVILSPNFFKKQWPQRELDGLVAREMSEARKVILPVWHQVSEADVQQYSPSLADKVALQTSMAPAEMAAQIAELFGPRDVPSLGDPEGIIDRLRKYPGVIDRLHKYRGVIAVELGPRMIQGVERGGVALRVVVAKKLPMHQLRPRDRLPSVLNGIEIDVVEA